MAERPVSAVVFDVGGVLLEWDPRHVYRDVFDDEAEMEHFLEEVCSREWHEGNDSGVPYAESWAARAPRVQGDSSPSSRRRGCPATG
jgi:FMN phosphatase YigB (HAD superfamily)